MEENHVPDMVLSFNLQWKRNVWRISKRMDWPKEIVMRMNP